MSLWLSERKTAGLWAGGLWKSQQGSPYAFNLDLSTFTDTVTGQFLSCNIDGTRYDEVNGITTAFGTDTPTIADKGLRICGAYSNLVKYSEDITVAAIWSMYSSAVAIDTETIQFNEATSRAVVTITNLGFLNSDVTDSGLKITDLSTTYTKYTRNKTFESKNFTLTIFLKADTTQKCTIYMWAQTFSSGSMQIRIIANGEYNAVSIKIKKTQLSQKKYAFPYIPTTTEVVSSPSEAGNSETGTGIWIDDVATKFPLLNTALTSQGTLTFKWKTGFNDADVSGNLNILSFNGTTDSAISYDADNNLINITDGTNTASKALTVVADTEYTIQATWGLVSGSPKMQIAVNGTAGSQTDFTGTFNPSDIYFGLENEELQYIKDLVVLKAATWL